MWSARLSTHFVGSCINQVTPAISSRRCPLRCNLRRPNLRKGVVPRACSRTSLPVLATIHAFSEPECQLEKTRGSWSDLEDDPRTLALGWTAQGHQEPESSAERQSSRPGWVFGTYPSRKFLARRRRSGSETVAAHDLRHLRAVRRSATRRTDYFCRLAKILGTNCSWRDHTECLYVL